jgi:hypothetical protein
VFIDLTADGSTTATTTRLTLTFDMDVEGLAVSDITLDAGSTGAIKTVLVSVGNGVYELGLSNITATGMINVSVLKSDYTINGGPKQITVFYAVEVEFSNLTADGSPIAATAKLTLTFDKDITGLTAEDISLDEGSGVSKGNLTRTDVGTYDLAISGITATETVSVTIVDKSGYHISSKTKTVTVYAPGSDTINIRFIGPTEKDISITRNITNNLSKSGGGSITLDINENFSSYEWYIGATKVANEKNVTLQASNTAFTVGDNWITIVVYEGTGSDAIPYSGEFMVLVTN